MGLIHPVDLATWQGWQERQQPWTRRLRGRLVAQRSRNRTGYAAGEGHPRLVICLDATSPTHIAALLAPLRHLDPSEVTVLSKPPPPADFISTAPSRGMTLDAMVALLRRARVVVSTGHFLPLGALAHRISQGTGRPFVTVQHGLLTPHTPPLASGTTLLSWSTADGDYWRSGREDVAVQVVGSQLLWEAGPSTHVTQESETPLYLGQLHGAELPTAVMAAAASDFCRRTGATYRPHPSETDRRSRATHAAWERAGITIDRSGAPLTQVRRPVVSVYSTGVLEAAARGLPAWVDLPDAPPWLAEFWHRNGMHRWGQDPTPALPRPAVEPSIAVAHVLREMMDR